MRKTRHHLQARVDSPPVDGDGVAALQLDTDLADETRDGLALEVSCAVQQSGLLRRHCQLGKELSILLVHETISLTREWVESNAIGEGDVVVVRMLALADLRHGRARALCRDCDIGLRRRVTDGSVCRSGPTLEPLDAIRPLLDIREALVGTPVEGLLVLAMDSRTTGLLDSEQRQQIVAGDVLGALVARHGVADHRVGADGLPTLGAVVAAVNREVETEDGSPRELTVGHAEVRSRGDCRKPGRCGRALQGAPPGAVLLARVREHSLSHVVLDGPSDQALELEVVERANSCVERGHQLGTAWKKMGRVGEIFAHWGAHEDQGAVRVGSILLPRTSGDIAGRDEALALRTPPNPETRERERSSMLRNAYRD